MRARVSLPLASGSPESACCFSGFTHSGLLTRVLVDAVQMRSFSLRGIPKFVVAARVRTLFYLIANPAVGTDPFIS